MSYFKRGWFTAGAGAAAGVVVLVSALAGCETKDRTSATAPAAQDTRAAGAPVLSGLAATDPARNVLTSDIQKGIEKHIADTSARNGGVFPLTFNGKEMKLKLVRVH